MILVPEIDAGVRLAEIELKTVENLREFRGLAAEFVSGTQLTAPSPDAVVVPDLNERLKQIEAVAGAAPRGSFFERNGVYWPADFHTWNMTTAYAIFEKTREYFIEHAPAGTMELDRLKVLYWVGTDDLMPLTDNAAYHPYTEAVFLPPFKDTPGVPLHMNAGALGHEVGHRVFSTQALNRGLVPRNSKLPAALLLLAIDEGFADYHGFNINCRFSSQCNSSPVAVSTGRAMPQRDLSMPSQCMTPELRSRLDKVREESASDFKEEPYLYGSIWAAALYQAQNKANNRTDAIARGLLLTYKNNDIAAPDLSKLVSNFDNVTPEAVANAIVTNTNGDATLKRDLCEEFSSRLDLSCSAFPCAAMPACPADTKRKTCGQ